MKGTLVFSSSLRKLIWVVACASGLSGLWVLELKPSLPFPKLAFRVAQTRWSFIVFFPVFLELTLS